MGGLGSGGGSGRGIIMIGASGMVHDRGLWQGAGRGD